MISAADLASMQATVASSLDQDCVITHVTASSQDDTGITIPSTATTSTVKCNIAAPSAQLLQQYADKIGTQKTYKVRFAATVAPAEGDTLLINGETLTVQVLLQPESYSTSNLVLASEVK